MWPTQMTVESDCTIAIATLGDWLKNSHANFSTNGKQNQNQWHLERAIFPRFEQVTGNS